MFSSSCHLVLLLVLPYLVAALPRSRRLVQEETVKPSGKGFDIPIHTRRNAPSPWRTRKRDGISGSVGLGDNMDSLYTVPITMGNVTTSVQLDTGSSDLWIITDACQTSQCRKSSVTVYPMSSLTPSNTSVTMNYGDSTSGSFASGPVGSDTAVLAGISVSQQQFAAISNTTNPTLNFGAAGIFGLGFPSESQIQTVVVNQQFNTPSTTDSFLSSTFSNGPLLSRMALSGELEQPMFAVSLQRDTIDISGTGKLTIGKLPDGVDNSSLTWVPVRLYKPADGGLQPPSFAPQEVYPFRWEVALDAVYLDGQKLPDSTISSGQVSALIDTGNSILRGPSDVVQNILSTVSPSSTSSKKSNASPTVSCSTPHTLAFQIGGKMFPVDPRDFISSGKSDACVVDNLVSTDPPSFGALYSWSLGDTFLKSNLVAFYYGNLTHPSVDPPRIGFMSSVPSNSTQLLQNAVEKGFQSSIEAAPTANVASATATLLVSSTPAARASASASVTPSTSSSQASSTPTKDALTSQKTNSAISTLGDQSSRWSTTLVFMLFLFYWI